VRKPKAKFKPPTPKPSAPVAAGPHVPAWLLALLLGLVTVALYWPATHCAFVNYDDQVYVTQNVHVQPGLTWAGIKWVFIHPVDVNWHPLTLVSHMLDCQLYGLNPWGHHLTNVLLHAFNTALVFLLLRKLTGAVWRSVAVAAFFGWHPVHVESVAWIAERKDVLSTCFGLLTLVFYARYARSPTANRKSQIVNYSLAFFFLAAGLLSKAMLVTWPFVMLLLDYWPLGRFKIANLWRLVWEKIPFFGLVAAASAVTFLVQAHGGAVQSTDSVPLGARAGNALISYCRYLGKLFWPTKLAVIYPHSGYWPLVAVLLAGLLLIGLSVFVFMQRRRYPYLLTGWLWYLGTLVPVIGLVQVGSQAMADRYTYIPSLGALIVIVWGVCELTRHWRYQAAGLSAGCAAAMVLCMGLTRQQLGYWQDSEALFRHTIAVTENNDLAHTNLGDALIGKGQIDGAFSEYQEVVRLTPGYAPAHYNLGIVFDKLGRTDEAIREYQEAVRLDPNHADAHNNLGIEFLNQNRNDEAADQFQAAIRLKPDSAKVHNDLGIIFNKQGQVDEAVQQFQEAVRLQPDLAEAYNNLGFVLVEKGRIDEAIRQYQISLRLKPDYALAQNNIAQALKLKNAPPPH